MEQHIRKQNGTAILEDNLFLQIYSYKIKHTLTT